MFKLLYLLLLPDILSFIIVLLHTFYLYVFWYFKNTSKFFSNSYILFLILSEITVKIL